MRRDGAPSSHDASTVSVEETPLGAVDAAESLAELAALDVDVEMHRVLARADMERSLKVVRHHNLEAFPLASGDSLGALAAGPTEPASGIAKWRVTSPAA
eukprot:4278122-Pyramimonas_sp.AAC.1